MNECVQPAPRGELPRREVMQTPYPAGAFELRAREARLLARRTGRASIDFRLLYQLIKA